MRNASSSPDLETLNLIDALCDEFERELIHSDRADLSSYLNRCEPSIRPTLFEELLLLELEYQKLRGTKLNQAEYLTRFPQYAEQIYSTHFKLSRKDTLVQKERKATLPRLKENEWIGSFELVERIGSGASGELWKARDPRLQRTVALKVPHNRNLTEEELHRFLREGRTAAQLKHPNIISVHEVGRTDGIAYIVEDFIEGMDLRQWLKSHDVSGQQAAEFVAILAEAIHQAHEQGIIHRDIKPANVIVDKKGLPHIADFGLAKWAKDSHQMTLDGQILGTPAYMSPEQARGEVKQVDRRTDVYSLGALLYELITKIPPFQGEQAAVMHAVVNLEPEPPCHVSPDIPRDLETVCLKALEKTPANRYPSAQEMAVDLRRFMHGEPILARRVSSAEKSWRWMRRHPAIVLSIVLGLLVVGALGAVRMLAEENRQLLGLRPVSLATEPTGAQVTFVPLNEVTEEPMPEKMIHVKKVSPVEVELTPGDYLVVAVLEDGRFHEVLRHVPKKNENFRGHYRHLGWTMDEAGGIILPQIDIPDLKVVHGMAFIEGTDVKISSKEASVTDDSPVKKLQFGHIKSFYLDVREVTVGDYKRLSGHLPHDLGVKIKDNDFALTARYDQAVAFAEFTGKRLPTIKEFEYAATCRGESRWPWGDEPPASDVTEIGPVGTAAFDRLNIDPRVVGLASNVAEFTSTSAAVINPTHRAMTLPNSSLAPESENLTNNYFQTHRFVSGGGRHLINRNTIVDDERPTNTGRIVVTRGALEPWLGFRCVRSELPRTTPEAFRSR